MRWATAPGETGRRIGGSSGVLGRWESLDVLHGVAPWFCYRSCFSLQFLRLLLGAARLRHHSNRRRALRQEAAEFGGLSQAPGTRSLPLLLGGATVRRVSAEGRWGGAGLGRGRGNSWRRRCQWALVVAAGGVKNL